MPSSSHHSLRKPTRNWRHHVMSFSSAQFSSVALSCLTLCDSTDCRTPGLPVHHQLPEFTQTHIHRSWWCHLAISYSVNPLLLLPPIPPSIGVFSNESTLCMRWPKYWCFSFNISPSNDQSFTQDWSPLGWTGWISLLSKRLSRVFSSTTVQKHPCFSTQHSLWSNSHIHTWLLQKS